MAASPPLCAIGVHVLNIWRAAKAIFPFNLIIAVWESPIYNLERQVTAVELEFKTQNGWYYCFYFDVHDYLLREAIFREFSQGSNLNRDVCNEAKAKMVASGVNHHIYFDPTHGQRIIILMSTRPIDLRIFAHPHWQPL